jgi:dihydrofolate reductase
MGTVYSGASMSLDGYVAGPAESGFEHLFAWYDSGDIETRTTHPELTFHLTETGAEHMKSIMDMTGVLVVGRRLFDLTDGWGGSHPLDKPVVVVTHQEPDGWPRDDAPFTFVTDGIESAVAQAKDIAGDEGVAVNAGTIARQCLEAGLLDEVWIDLVPVVLGDGVPFFAGLSERPVVLDGPYSVIEDARVTHLRYRVTAAPG